jgi:hypothetical protein
MSYRMQRIKCSINETEKHILNPFLQDYRKQLSEFFIHDPK